MEPRKKYSIYSSDVFKVMPLTSLIFGHYCKNYILSRDYSF